MSVVIFLTVMTTLSDTLAIRKDLRVRIPNTHSSVNHLLYADDTCITAHFPAACQELLNLVEWGLDWEKMKAKPTKSRVLFIKASSGKIYYGMPHVSQSVVSGSRQLVIGLLSSLECISKCYQIQLLIETLKQSLEEMLKAIGVVPVTHSQKVRL